MEGETEFPHIPDWYRWEQDSVRKELEEGTYLLDVPVDICMMVDTKSIYRVGKGRLRHTAEGFRLIGCAGQKKGVTGKHYRRKKCALQRRGRASSESA